ncbi:hypothetical protein [Pseudomonas putida]|uniref:hypothetical protein n=1 Tax=Pseudomonas TaxID=286 RepID=UPI00085A810C|nr:hypothetical protein [Pseudomonas putida]
MSEVHRYQVVTMLSEEGSRIGYDPHGPYVVMAEAYDQLELEVAKLQLAITLSDDAAIQDDCVRTESRQLCRNIEALCALLREVRSARDWNGSLSAMAKRIDAALIKYAEPPVCQKFSDTGLTDSGGVQAWGEPILVPCECAEQSAEECDQ